MEANLLAGDAINNYRTVSSFGHDDLLIKQYHEYVKIPEKTQVRKGQCIAFWFGFGQFN